MSDGIIILISAFILDCILGDPVYKMHPVRLIGHLIMFLEKILYPLKLNKVFSGFILTVAAIIIVSSVYSIIYLIIYLYIPYCFSVLFNIYIVYSCISLKDLTAHAKKVFSSLSISLSQARKDVQMIVGRNAELLDKTGIIKATVECIAESFVDGIISPFFWYTIGILTALIHTDSAIYLSVLFVLLQRTVNTLDSMVGYKNEKYMFFGRFSAKLDDLLNFIPARLSIFIIPIAALFLKMDYSQCFKTAMRDRLNHSSPNSAHSESAVAGALGIQLGGPTTYNHGTVDKPYLGRKINEIKPEHIFKTIKLISVSSLISLAFSCTISQITISLITN